MGDRVTPEELEVLRARQRARSRVLAWLLAAFCVLMFAITIAKIQAGWN